MGREKLFVFLFFFPIGMGVWGYRSAHKVLKKKKSYTVCILIHITILILFIRSRGVPETTFAATRPQNA